MLNTVLFGDVRETLQSLPDCLFHCCVTSPPYFNLRSYLKKDDPLKSLEIGSERTAAEFIETMVDVFRGVRRVLRDDGVLFVNFGDSYDAGTRTELTPCTQEKDHGYWNNENIRKRITTESTKTGDQLLMPHRV